ncbi:hypothetical protein PJK54_03540 [Cobetia sp. MMG027]|uniref:hypothetical protein n=1 Tax=Cobetia sp. MMG027 TaxID=3021980 RepID=UPI0022FDE551|nr:hypothetical protein [Cobetia sp. MMG027]MDA5562740.1 hypothetical protein [Cobetia sp. MMG027]
MKVEHQGDSCGISIFESAHNGLEQATRHCTMFNLLSCLNIFHSVDAGYDSRMKICLFAHALGALADGLFCSLPAHRKARCPMQGELAEQEDEKRAEEEQARRREKEKKRRREEERNSGDPRHGMTHGLTWEMTQR